MKFFKRKEEENKEDEYGLTKTVQLTDIKGYLQNEYERAEAREATISELENQIEKYREIELKYNAMLVVQEQTKARTDRQDETIKDLKEKNELQHEKTKELNAKIIDIKTNAEKKLKEKDSEIKELKAQIKELKAQIKKSK